MIHQPELFFDEASHSYAVGNEILPSVTTIIKGAGVYSSYDHVPEEILKRASEIGTEVHKVVEEHHLMGLPLHSEDASVEAYLEAYRAFMLLGYMRVDFCETRAYHPDLGYAGTVDIVGEIAGSPAIVDIKTTNKLNEQAVDLQLAAYEGLISYHTGETYKRFALWLKKDGNFVLYPSRDPLAWPEFVRLVEKHYGVEA